MTDTRKLKPERALQLIFSKFKLFSGLTVALPIFALAVWLKGQPSRSPQPDRVVWGQANRVAAARGLTMWRLVAPDPRLGGLSALAVDRGQLIALTDSGVAVTFTPPEAGSAVRFALHDLPDGPGSPRRKAMRDSESLLGDGSGGWWVGFEHHHSLWHFDRAFRRVLGWQRLKVGWGRNFGGEALVAGSGGEVMVLPERGGRAWTGKAGGAPLVAPEWTSDATRMPDGRLVLLVRRPTWRGFEHELRIAAGAGKPPRRIALAVGRLDNLEGIAAGLRPGGGTRLWLVSDDNFRPWMRTLLVRIDLPPST